MKKYKILSYVLLSICISYYIQDLVAQKTYATNFKEQKSYVLDESNAPNFIEASEKAIQAVVHIKSKYLSNEIYRYYDPFYGNRYFNHPKENIASGSGVIISEDGYIVTNRHVINNTKR